RTAACRFPPPAALRRPGTAPGLPGRSTPRPRCAAAAGRPGRPSGGRRPRSATAPAGTPATPCPRSPFAQADCASRSPASRLLPQAVQVARRTQEDLAAADRRRAQDALAEVVARDHLDPRPGPEHERLAGLVGDVEQAAGEDGRGTEAALEAVLPDLLARRRLEARDRAAVGNHVEPAVVVQRR